MSAKKKRSSKSPDGPSSPGLTWSMKVMEHYEEYFTPEERRQRLLEALSLPYPVNFFRENDDDEFGREFEEMTVKQQREARAVAPQWIRALLEKDRQREQELLEEDHRKALSSAIEDAVGVATRVAAARLREIEDGHAKACRSLKRKIGFLRTTVKIFGAKLTRFGVLLLLILASVAGTLWLVGEVQSTQIEVTYDVAEMIAALLGGTGVAAAGVAYAAKTIDEGSER